MPMHKAKISRSFKNAAYPDVEIGLVNWYNTVIRISGYNRNSVADIAGEIIEGWKVYNDESVDIIGMEADGTRHNTCTTIVRFLPDNRYSVDLILRNNRTSEQYPDGIFHAHPEYHNIKKEGIGLIEAMGLYILPARLKRQLGEIEQILITRDYKPEEVAKADHPLHVHKDMIDTLMAKNSSVKDEARAKEIVTAYVNDVCVNILKNTAVFKNDEKGIAALVSFLESVNIR